MEWNSSATGDYEKVTCTVDLLLLWGGFGSGKGAGSRSSGTLLFFFVEGGWGLSLSSFLDKLAFSLNCWSFSRIFCFISAFDIRASAVSGKDMPIAVTDKVIKESIASLRLRERVLGFSWPESTFHLIWNGRISLGVSSLVGDFLMANWVDRWDAILKMQEAIVGCFWFSLIGASGYSWRIGLCLVVKDLHYTVL